MKSIKTAVIGCGLVGKRRATVASTHPSTSLEIVADISKEAAQALAKELGCKFETKWQRVIANPEISLIVISTPNYMLAPIAIAAMKAGKNVLIEKPMGVSLKDALDLQEVALKSGCKLKIGFNHRYHPAIFKAYELVSAGRIGKIINLRGCYGHGGRPGYEKEWRGDFKQAGGGELTDQGVHLIDLVNWFVGKPNEVFAVLQTAVWPIQPLEDNAFAIFKYSNGVLASIHTSWTQWKNLFSFELFGKKGFLSIEGIGGSYGVERLIFAKRNLVKGVPDIVEETFETEDNSWAKEWDDFVSHIKEGTAYLGTPEEGVSVMRILEGLYKSSRMGRVFKYNSKS